MSINVSQPLNGRSLPMVDILCLFNKRLHCSIVTLPKHRQIITQSIGLKALISGEKTSKERNTDNYEDVGG